MKIHIVGKGDGWEDVLNETEGEFWYINYYNPQTTRLFNIHPPDHEFYTKNIRDIENARAADCPVTTQENWLMPELMEIFNTDYFGSSTDYLLAYAALKGCKEVHLWGVTMDDLADHYPKKCATDFWCGVLHGRGAIVHVHGNSTVMTTSDGLTYGTFQPMKRQFKQI